MTDFQIEHIDTIDSTNTALLKRASQGAPNGLVLWTDYQTHGRGRFERTWDSPREKNLLFSILLRPQIKAHEAPIFTQIACQSVLATLKTYGLKPTVKKPNDVLVDGKKICGVLTESVSKSNGEIDYLVIGIGLNVNSDDSELIDGAISMKLILEKDFLIQEIIEKILNNLKNSLDSYLE